MDNKGAQCFILLHRRLLANIILLNHQKYTIVVNYLWLAGHGAVNRTDFTDLNLYCIKGALALFVLVSFSGYATCARLDKAEYSAFESTLNSLYRIVSY